MNYYKGVQLLFIKVLVSALIVNPKSMTFFHLYQ